MDLNQKALNYIQVLSAEMIRKANSGHTGVALGASTILYALFKDHYRFDVSGENINRDRFVLSAGHASALYYSILYTFGFDYKIEDLENFRQIGSITPGHPERNEALGIDCSTGPLGQGVANAVGMAIASKRMAEIYNVQKMKVFDNKIYCFVGDGCLMEGVAQEAISLAGTLGLNNLILLYDCNKVTIDGTLEISNHEDTASKFVAQGFNVVEVSNGNDYLQVTKAIEKAKKSTKPCVIIFNTKIGFNSDVEGKNVIHGRPLSDEEFQNLKNKLGVTTTMFIPKAVLRFCKETTIKNQKYFEEWEKKLLLYQSTHPELYKSLANYKLQLKFQAEKIYKNFSGDISGRDANFKILNEVALKNTSLIGGSADLTASTKTLIENAGAISKNSFRGRNINFGIREHAMGAVCNGISLYDNSRTFCSTFLSFSNYMMPAIRMSAMMNLPVWFMFTHDSIFVGEDGPTHQSIEQLGQLRLVPSLHVFRPCDAVELCDLYEIALNMQSPCAFVLSRQKLPVLSSGKKTKYGMYVISECSNADLTLLASGSEVSMCFKAKDLLEKDGIKCQIVSAPCIELFEKQSKQYRSSILNGKVVAVEASNDNIWYRYTKNVFSINDFGHSGKPDDVAKHMKYTYKHLYKFCLNALKN